MTSSPAGVLLPTLGPQIVDWMEANLVHGRGAVSGEPYRPTREHQRLIYKAYELYPRDHPRAGQRVYDEVWYSRGKGLAKTELGAAIAAAELGPDGLAPVRFGGWDADGEPVGIAVRDPELIFLSNTLEQAGDLTYTRLRDMLEEGPLADLVDCGDERIQCTQRRGVARPVTARAKSKEGGQPTFIDGDEPHLWTTEELHELTRTLVEGIGKAAARGAWALFHGTAFAPGERSVAEAAKERWDEIEAEGLDHDGFLFDHLAAGPEHDLETEDGRRAAFDFASGAAPEFRNVEFFLRRWRDKRTDKAKLRRYWLNQIVKGSTSWLSSEVIKAAIRAELRVTRREPIALGFDGSKKRDNTALIGCRLSDGHLFVIGVWRRPPDHPPDAPWRVDPEEVDIAVRAAFREHHVVQMFGDPWGWESYLTAWAAEFGEDVVVEFDTREGDRMAAAIDRLETDFVDGKQTIDGHPVFVEHLENTRFTEIGSAARRRADERPPKRLRKEHENSDLKIDCTVAAVLAKAAAARALRRGISAVKRRARRLFA